MELWHFIQRFTKSFIVQIWDPWRESGSSGPKKVLDALENLENKGKANF